MWLENILYKCKTAAVGFCCNIPFNFFNQRTSIVRPQNSFMDLSGQGTEMGAWVNIDGDNKYNSRPITRPGIPIHRNDLKLIKNGGIWLQVCKIFILEKNSIL